MDGFQELYSIAEILDSAPYVEKARRTADAIEKQEKTVVAVTGMRSSGKTTVINRMLGREVWEPGNMDDDEKPLRICFEPMEDDERYQCILAVNHEWNSREAVIYELREEDIVQDDALTDVILAADKVLFLVSATAPFNMNEIALLKKMRVLDCQVVVNGIDAVKEEERQNVIDYIAKRNNSLNLPPIIIMEGSEEEFGKKIRNILPSYMEQKESREKRRNAIIKNTVDGLGQILNLKAAEYEKDKLSKEGILREKHNFERMKANCYTLRMDVEEYKQKAKKAAQEGLAYAVSDMTANAMKKVAEASQANIDRIVEQEYKKKAVSVMEILQKCYVNDVKKVNSDASLLGLPGWDAETIKVLERYSPLSAKMERPKRFSEKGNLDQGQSVSMGQESSKILIGTGLIVGGFFLAPLPSMVALAGGVISAGVGGNMYLKKRQEEKLKSIETRLKEIFASGAANIKNLIAESADYCYGKITEFIQSSEEQLAEPKEDAADDGEMEKRLEKASELLRAVKEQKNLK